MRGKPPKDIKVLYITTPANTYPPKVAWAVEAVNDVKNQGFEVTEFDIEGKKEGEVKDLVAKSDVVWVSGGNVFYFLYWAQKVNLKSILADFLKNGGVYAGESAGVVCHIKDLEPIKWFDHPEKAPEVVKEGMQLTNIIALPHAGHPKYGPIVEKIKTYYEKKGLTSYLLSDGEALIINGETAEKISKPVLL